MQIDIEREDIFLLSDGPSRVKKSYSTLKRYIDTGVRNQSTGIVVRLASIYLPTGLATSIQAYRRFLMQLNGISPLDSTS